MPKNLQIDIALEVVLPEGNPYAATYVLRFGDCTGLDDLACRRATGFTILELLAEREKNPSMTAVVAAFIAWQTIRKDGHTTFEQVAASMPWGQEWEIRDANSDPKDEPGSEPTPPDTESSADSSGPVSLPGDSTS